VIRKLTEKNILSAKSEWNQNQTEFLSTAGGLLLGSKNAKESLRVLTEESALISCVMKLVSGECRKAIVLRMLSNLLPDRSESDRSVFFADSSIYD
jgi:hypothetical protein